MFQDKYSQQFKSLRQHFNAQMASLKARQAEYRNEYATAGSTRQKELSSLQDDIQIKIAALNKALQDLNKLASNQLQTYLHLNSGSAEWNERGIELEASLLIIQAELLLVQKNIKLKSDIKQKSDVDEDIGREENLIKGLENHLRDIKKSLNIYADSKAEQSKAADALSRVTKSSSSSSQNLFSSLTNLVRNFVPGSLQSSSESESSSSSESSGGSDSSSDSESSDDELTENEVNPVQQKARKQLMEKKRKLNEAIEDLQLKIRSLKELLPELNTEEVTRISTKNWQETIPEDGVGSSTEHSKQLVQSTISINKTGKIKTSFDHHSKEATLFYIDTDKSSEIKIATLSPDGKLTLNKEFGFSANQFKLTQVEDGITVTSDWFDIKPGDEKSPLFKPMRLVQHWSAATKQFDYDSIVCGPYYQDETKRVPIWFQQRELKDSAGNPTEIELWISYDGIKFSKSVENHFEVYTSTISQELIELNWKKGQNQTFPSLWISKKTDTQETNYFNKFLTIGPNTSPLNLKFNSYDEGSKKLSTNTFSFSQVGETRHLSHQTQVEPGSTSAQNNYPTTKIGEFPALYESSDFERKKPLTITWQNDKLLQSVYLGTESEFQIGKPNQRIRFFADVETGQIYQQRGQYVTYADWERRFENDQTGWLGLTEEQRRQRIQERNETLAAFKGNYPNGHIEYGPMQRLNEGEKFVLHSITAKPGQANAAPLYVVGKNITAGTTSLLVADPGNLAQQGYGVYQLRDVESGRESSGVYVDPNAEPVFKQAFPKADLPEMDASRGALPNQPMQMDWRELQQARRSLEKQLLQVDLLQKRARADQEVGISSDTDFVRWLSDLRKDIVQTLHSEIGLNAQDTNRVEELKAKIKGYQDNLAELKARHQSASGEQKTSLARQISQVEQEAQKNIPHLEQQIQGIYIESAIKRKEYYAKQAEQFRGAINDLESQLSYPTVAVRFDLPEQSYSLRFELTGHGFNETKDGLRPNTFKLFKVPKDRRGREEEITNPPKAWQKLSSVMTGADGSTQHYAVLDDNNDLIFARKEDNKFNFYVLGPKSRGSEGHEPNVNDNLYLVSPERAKDRWQRYAQLFAEKFPGEAGLDYAGSHALYKKLYRPDSNTNIDQVVSELLEENIALAAESGPDRVAKNKKNVTGMALLAPDYAAAVRNAEGKNAIRELQKIVTYLSARLEEAQAKLQRLDEQEHRLKVALKALEDRGRDDSKNTGKYKKSSEKLRQKLDTVQRKQEKVRMVITNLQDILTEAKEKITASQQSEYEEKITLGKKCTRPKDMSKVDKSYMVVPQAQLAITLEQIQASSGKNAIGITNKTTLATAKLTELNHSDNAVIFTTGEYGRKILPNGRKSAYQGGVVSYHNGDMRIGQYPEGIQVGDKILWGSPEEQRFVKFCGDMVRNYIKLQGDTAVADLTGSEGSPEQRRLLAVTWEVITGKVLPSATPASQRELQRVKNILVEAKIITPYEHIVKSETFFQSLQPSAAPPLDEYRPGPFSHR